MVDVIRTSDDRFLELPDWPYESRYTTVDGFRLARVDEGPHDADEVVVLVHGLPSWGYLYRHVIPPLLAAGHRVIAPDHVGFGRSDKPAERDWYSYDRVVESFTAHLAEIPREAPVTLVVHDWGGPIGLRCAVEHADQVRRLVITNTGLYAPGGRASEAFDAWQGFVRQADALPIGLLFQNSIAREMGEDELAGYEAPFPDAASQAGALALPLLVPTTDEHAAAAAMFAVLQALETWDRPTLCLWGADDPIIPPRVGQRFADSIPGAGELETVSPAMHFLFEDLGAEIGERIARFITEA